MELSRELLKKGIKDGWSQKGFGSLAFLNQALDSLGITNEKICYCQSFQTFPRLEAIDLLKVYCSLEEQALIVYFNQVEQIVQSLFQKLETLIIGEEDRGL